MMLERQSLKTEQQNCCYFGWECALTQGELLRYVRERFPTNDRRNGSVAVRLIKKFGLREAEAMIRGAKALGLESLIPLNAKAGEFRRHCQAKFWHEINMRGTKRKPQLLGDILRKAIEDSERKAS